MTVLSFTYIKNARVQNNYENRCLTTTLLQQNIYTILTIPRSF